MSNINILPPVISTAATVVNFSAGTTSGNLGSVVFSNSNGVTFGLNGSTITASAAAGGGAGISAGTQSVNTGTVVFSNSNGITFGMSGSSRITASHNGITLQSTQPVAVSGSNGSFAFSTLSLGNSNGISFYTTNGSVVASHTVPAVPPETPFGISAGTQSVSTGTLVFSNSNGITFGMSGSSRITASHNGLTSQSTAPAAISAGTTQATSGTVVFSNSNGVSFGLNGNTLTASVVAGGGNTGSISAGTTRATLGEVVWSNSNGISFGVNGQTVTASYTVPAAQTTQPVAISGSNGSFAFSTVTFGNLNGVSFYTSNGSVVASYTVPAAQTNQTLGLYATSNTTQSSSGTVDARSLTFAGAGLASVGVTGNSIVVSVPAGAPSPVNFSAGTTSGDLGSVVFSNSNGVSFGLNGSTITASVAAAGGITYSGFNPSVDVELVAGQVGNASLAIQPLGAVPHFQFDSFVMPVIFVATSNSSNSFTVSFNVGVYTMNASTLSLYASTSASANVSLSGTAGSYSLYNTARLFAIPWTSTLSAGNYWLGIQSRTTTGGGAGMSLSQYMKTQVAASWSGVFGISVGASKQVQLGQGHYTSTTTALPSAIPLNSIIGTGSAHNRKPVAYFVSGSS